MAAPPARRLRALRHHLAPRGSSASAPRAPAPVTVGQLPALVATTDAVFGRVAPKSMETDYPRVYAPENLGHVFAIPTDDGEGVAA